MVSKLYTKFQQLSLPKTAILEHPLRFCTQLYRNSKEWHHAGLAETNFGAKYACATKAIFTLYRIVKRSVTESVPDRASVHTRNAAFEAVSAPEQYCSALLLKVERSVSDRFLKRSESSVYTFIGAEIATEPRFGK